jgi:hypothetical protein
MTTPIVLAGWSGGVPRLLTERGRGLEAGEGADAVDHRGRDTGELAVRRGYWCQHRGRVMRGADLDQDCDGKCRDHGHFPGDKEQVDPGRDADAQVRDTGHRRDDDQEQRPAADGHMRQRDHQL